ncbi:PQQ-dependent sugar dehydrogenase [Peredibacter starrii]|uniref:PQQ-dependent sugar dehydrogenase n=1 Tax=Peredibacter starrii TaxID=28202 RepID=A0AAX4HRY7_9BACT|nr:PQQ-dependent sugar dehydrogenase [Peredibacter starrii]WPU65868.1 PQQ-dependent sugar dehydrogenase [Peredibacter starrii]
MHFLIFILFFAIACSNNDSGSDAPQSQQENTQLEVLLDRSDVIWGFDFLPDKRIIFTERSGHLLVWDPNQNSTSDISGLPPISSSGESGLLDLELHPNFDSNQLVYFCYSEPGRTIALGRGELNESTLNNVQKLFSANNANSSSIHFGCRIEFDDAGKVFLSLGDQNEPSRAQDSNSFLGKIVRMNDDGSGLEIWSSGHRNVQGLAIRPGTNDLFEVEHGPTGGDELNIIEQGNNYGWPLVTRGEPAGELGQSAPGFVDPLASWTPAIAPSGITFYQGDLYIACLRGRQIRRISLDGSTVTNQEILFSDAGYRFRNLRPGPDGFLYFSTDSGELGRIVPSVSSP